MSTIFRSCAKIPSISEYPGTAGEYVIGVRGEVNRPDTLPFRDGMTVEDAILRSGGLKESASYAKIEVARRIKDPNSTSYTNKTADLYTFNIDKDLSIAPEVSRFVLQPFDEVYVRRVAGIQRAAARRGYGRSALRRRVCAGHGGRADFGRN